MKALSMKQIFKAVEMNNTLSDITLDANKVIVIYVDDEKIYEGNDYKAYERVCKKEYIPSFADYLINSLFTTNITKFYCEFGYEHKIEFYTYSR